eukprot:scaffold396333_cov33-Prasinocladus_malaysianus.AAC.1
MTDRWIDGRMNKRNLEVFFERRLFLICFGRVIVSRRALLAVPDIEGRQRTPLELGSTSD